MIKRAVLALRLADCEVPGLRRNNPHGKREEMEGSTQWGMAAIIKDFYVSQ